MISQLRGIAPHKRINGRKRQLVVDTQGRLWAARVHAANEADSPAATRLITDMLWAAGERLEKILGDQVASAVRLQRRFFDGSDQMEY